jgi:amino acid transporter
VRHLLIFVLIGFVTSYFGFAFSVVMFGGWKILKKTKFVKAADADLVSGKKETDEECLHWEEGGIEENEKRRLAEMSFGKRCWERCW